MVEGVENLGRESLVSLAVMVTNGEIRLPKGGGFLEFTFFSFFLELDHKHHDQQQQNL